MSEIGGISNPFAPKQTTASSFLPIPPQTSSFNPFSVPNSVITPTPTSSLPSSTLTISDIVTETEQDPGLAAQSTSTPTGTNTLTITDSENQNRNNDNNNTISTAAIIFSIMIGFVIVGGCIGLIFVRKRPENKKKSKMVRRNVYDDSSSESDKSNDVCSQINSISPPLNLPPLPPRHSPPPPFQRFPPPPQHSPPSPSPPRNSLPPPPRNSPPPLSRNSSRNSLSPLPQNSSQNSPPPSPRHSPPLPPIPQYLPPLPPIPHPPTVLYRNPSLVRNGSSSKNYRDYHFLEHDPAHDPKYHYQKYSQLRPQPVHHNNVEYSSTNIDVEPP